MRALTTTILGLSIIFAPSWLYLPILLIAIFLHPLYLEGIAMGLVIDTLYGVSDGAPTFGYTFGLAATLAIIVATPMRKYLRFNE